MARRPAEVQAGRAHAPRTAERRRSRRADELPGESEVSATTVPTTTPAPSLWVRRPAGAKWAGWLRTVDHKEIGVLYMGMALLFFVFGVLTALTIRLQLAVPDNHLVDPA